MYYTYKVYKKDDVMYHTYKVYKKCDVMYHTYEACKEGRPTCYYHTAVAYRLGKASCLEVVRWSRNWTVRSYPDKDVNIHNKKKYNNSHDQTTM